MIRIFLGTPTEQWNMKILLKNSTRRKGRSFDGASQWSLHDWISILAKGGGAKKRFQYCLNPNSSRHISYFGAIQGHSGSAAIDPELQDNVLLPKGITEYIYRVGNVSEVHSIIRSGLIPGGQSLKRERQIRVLHDSEPDGRWKIVWKETPCDLTKAKDCSVQKYLETSSEYSMLVQFVTRSRERIAVLPGQGRMQSSSTTHYQLFASRKWYVHEDEGWAIPKGTLDSESTTGCTKIEFAMLVHKINVNRMQEHLMTNQADSKNAVGNLEQHRGLQNSLVYLFPQLNSKYTHRKDKVKSWSRSSRTTRTKNPSFKISSRRRRSTSSARNRRISSLTWTTQRSSSSAKHLQNSNALIATYTGKQALSTVLVEDAQEYRGVKRRIDKSNNDVVSIPGYVIKKNNKRGTRHGLSERQRMYYKA